MRGGRSISNKVKGLCGSSIEHPNGIYPSPNMLIQLSWSTSTGVKYETWGCFHCEFGVTGPRVYVSVYTQRRYEGGRVRLIVGGPTGIEIVVLEGHVIVGLSKKRIPPPGLATSSRVEMGVGDHVHVCMYKIVRRA